MNERDNDKKLYKLLLIMANALLYIVFFLIIPVVVCYYVFKMPNWKTFIIANTCIFGCLTLKYSQYIREKKRELWKMEQEKEFQMLHYLHFKRRQELLYYDPDFLEYCKRVAEEYKVKDNNKESNVEEADHNNEDK